MKKRLGHMTALAFTLLSGLLFGLGLILAGMTNPAKVLAFLDLAGLWDPSLGLVMTGAIAVGLIAYSIAGKRSTSFLGLPMNIPTSRIIDKRLVIGSLVFGIGWGLVGICPAPAFVLLGTGNVKGVVFLIAMLIGMGAFELLEGRRKK
ncbi:MAG: YeeE/YedE family protein [Methylotenera sp.]|nr:YeeE/YedE family protein [Methylotenera sp.]MSP99644.1 YeeE/YedE family protein [Methylotenera sp.]